MLFHVELYTTFKILVYQLCTYYNHQECCILCTVLALMNECQDTDIKL
jgi:hypothetical protein